MHKIKAVIFDMDGVLIEAKEWHYEALNRALEMFGYSISRYDHLITYDGLPTVKKMEMLSIERGLPRKLHKFIGKLKQQYTTDKIYTACRPIFIHEFALSSLKSQGYFLALASNAVRSSVELMMTKSNLLQYMCFCLSNQDVCKPKPHPEIYQTAIKKFNLKPEECLVIEDNQNGILSAQASGAHVMIVKTVYDVTYENIIKHIHFAEDGKLDKTRRGMA